MGKKDLGDVPVLFEMIGMAIGVVVVLVVIFMLLSLTGSI